MHTNNIQLHVPEYNALFPYKLTVLARIIVELAPLRAPPNVISVLFFITILDLVHEYAPSQMRFPPSVFIFESAHEQWRNKIATRRDKSQVI